MVNSTKTFLNSIGESTAEANLARVLTMIRRTQNGDKECIKFFKLSKLPLLQLDLVKKVPYFSSLQNQFNCYQTYALVGEHLKDDVFKVVATALCSYINWIARESEPNRQIVCEVDGGDICTSLLEELHFITNFISDCQWKLLEFDRKERQRGCDDIEEELEDPSYDPEVDDDEEEEESKDSEGSQGVEAASCEENFPRATTTKALKRKETSDDPKPPAKKPKVTADPKPPANKPTVSKEEKKKEGKRSHHAKRICPVCNKQESNLRRHLQSHAWKGLIEPGAVERFLSMATRKGKRRGPRRKSGDTVKKGLRMKWCPFPGCEFVTHQLRSHLTHKHRLKQGTLLEKYLSVAEIYEGQQEMDEVKASIHSYRQKRRGESSTSSITTATSSDTSTTTATPSLITSTITASTSAAPASPSLSSTPKSPAPSSLQATAQDHDAWSEDEDSDTVQEYFASVTPSNDRHC